MSPKISPSQKEENKPLSVSFQIPYPVLWLLLLVSILYSGSLTLGFTELDDTIFVNEFHAYNEKPASLIHSFQRGVFSDTNDIYYRPMLLNSFVVNTLMTDGNTLQPFHGFNIFLHLLAVILLFFLLRKLLVEQPVAFLLAAIFAVHPVLTQAVSWIPGRNDSLLGVFAFAYMLCCLAYFKKPNGGYLLAQYLFLLSAFFTKETGLLIPLAFFILLSTLGLFSWKDKQHWIIAISWVLAGVGWYLVRSLATVKVSPLMHSDAWTNAIKRIPVALQYLGKAILPVNLSVFPMQNQTSYVYGILAFVLLAVGLYFSKSIQRRVVIGGAIWFVLLLTPLFLLPSAINDQDFEHRLYLPFLGLLLILSQTCLFVQVGRTKMLIIGGALIAVLSVLSYQRQSFFSDAKTFWEEAVRTTPKSAYANMMLAARIDSSDLTRAKQLMYKAYQLNPNEKYINYYLGKQCLDEGKLDDANVFLQRELSLSAYYDTYFLLSRLRFQQQDTLGSIRYMEQYLEKDPSNPQAVNNLILMLVDSKQKEKARQLIAQKQKEGVSIGSALIDLAK